MFPKSASSPPSPSGPLLRMIPLISASAALLLVVGCDRGGTPPGDAGGAPSDGPRVEATATAAPESGVSDVESRAQPHLDGASFTGEVRPGLAARGLIDFLEAHVGAKVVLAVELSGFEGEVGREPAFFWLRPLCDREEREAAPDAGRCRDSHVSILGPPEELSLDEEAGVARLRGTFGIEAPEDPRPGLRTWRLVANPIRKSELPASGSEEAPGS